MGYATIDSPFPKNKATENFLISAALAPGVTIIQNAAMEPEISDRNEAVSLATAAYLTKGDVYLRGAQQDTLLTFLNTLSKMRLPFEVDDAGIRFYSNGAVPPPIALETDVHPGFMTDWQQPFTVLLTQAEGMSVVHETIYEDRFGYTTALTGMGAHI